MPSNNRFDDVMSALREGSNDLRIPNLPDSKMWNWDLLDKSTQQYATRLAEYILGSNAPIALVGDYSSGRRHLLNVVASAGDHWREFAGNAPVLYDLETPPGTALNPQSAEPLLNDIKKRIAGAEPYSRLILSDLYSANIADSMGIPVALRTNCAEFFQESHKRGDLQRWNIIHTCLMEYSVTDVIRMLSLDQKARSSAGLRLPHEPSHIIEFVKEILRTFEQIAPFDNGEREVINTTPGSWVRAYTRAASHAAMNGATPAEVIADLEDELREDFGLFPVDFGDEDEGFLGQLFGAVQGQTSDQRRKGPLVENADQPKGLLKDPEAIKAELQKVIIGQDRATAEVADSLLAAAAGMNSATKPLQSMLLLGPTGVGKTETALTLAKTAMDKPMNVIRLDMSEYADEHARSKLFGSPPGYVGYDEGGVLTNGIAANPYSLILLDEIEKAHPEIWDQFLQVLDAGRMTDGRGVTHDFTKSIVVMTSNLGTSKSGTNGIGFNTGAVESAHSRAAALTRSAVRETMKPEFINRIGVQILFDPLSDETVAKIIKGEVDKIRARASTSGYRLVGLRADIVSMLAEQVSHEYGARDVQRVVDKYIAQPTARAIIGARGSNSDNSKLTIKMKNKEISVSTGR